MKDETQKVTDDTRSALESEGIIIESISAKEELEQDLNTPQTKEEEKALFDAIGVEIPKEPQESSDPTTDALKNELNSGGIEVLPSDPLENENL